MAELGKIRRLTDGMLAKAAKRVEDTKAPTRGGDRSAADQLARETGLGSGEAKRAMGTAADLEALPATDAAVHAGELSARQADLIAATAKAVGNDPAVERELLDAAGQGMVPLREKCIEVRARSEDQSERSTRLHAGRSFRKWTNAEGMCEGHFKVTPEVGGTIDAVISSGYAASVPRSPGVRGAGVPGCVRGRRVRRRDGTRLGR